MGHLGGRAGQKRGWGHMETAAATGSDGTAGMPMPDITLAKGSAKRSFPFQGDETLEFIPLGAGNEVGRSCCILKVRWFCLASNRAVVGKLLSCVSCSMWVSSFAHQLPPGPSFVCVVTSFLSPFFAVQREDDHV